MFTSRSAVEAYQNCPRYRFNQYHYQEKGIVSKAKGVPLVTGSAIHRGVEHLMNRLRIGEQEDVETAVGLAINQYVTDVGESGFLHKEIKTDKQQWFTFEEQKALTEALVRAWYIAEFPKIKERYIVLAVERDIEPLGLGNGILFQAKVDAEFQEKSTGDYHNYSLKSVKSWSERNELSYKGDLQSVTEMWAMDQDQERENKRIDLTIEMLRDSYSKQPLKYKNVPQITKWLETRKVDKKVSAIRFCFLIKGDWKVPPSLRNDPTAVRITYNPLIRGYKCITPTEVAYAHSWNYPNPDNLSGMGRLGKGWEPFNVWETDMGVKGWMELLAKGEIQPSCGDIIKAQVVTPIEYFRSDKEVEMLMEEVAWQESKIQGAIDNLEYYSGGGGNPDKEFAQRVLADTFPHYKKHCEFHFGSTCEYKEFCFNPSVNEDPLGSGLYQIRTPHHEFEV